MKVASDGAPDVRRVLKGDRPGMKIAFAIFRYFPYGGLQRDMLRIAVELRRRGHDVVIYCGAWEGPVAPEGVRSVVLRPHGWSNHARAWDFIRLLQEELRRQPADGLVAFNRMPGADVYFAADNCFAAAAWRKVGILSRWLPRYRSFCKLERSVFGQDASTVIMYLTPHQLPDFTGIYHTPLERLRLLPPGIAPDRRRPPDAEARRAAKRRELGIDDGGALLLEVGSGFFTKGVDRAVAAVGALPGQLRRRVRLAVTGRGRQDAMRQLAERLGIGGQVSWLGGRDDVPDLLLAADLLIHPARNEATGTVLIEALAAGLPVLTTANCGFADFVAASGGEVVPEPFRQEQLDRSLAAILGTEGRLAELKQAATAYGAQADFYSRAGVAADIIEQVIKHEQTGSESAL